MKLRIGTRGSDLALWQSNRIKHRIEHELKTEAEIIIFKTQGDQIQNVPLSQLEGKGFFTKELEDALLDNKIDLAVHSLKDLPTTLPDGLKIAAIPERHHSQDRLIIRKGFQDLSQPFFLKKNSVLGTSSNRRIDQAKNLQPDLQITMLRGNVPTRVQKLRDGKYDAIILAAAGLDRLLLDLSDFDTIDLDQNLFVSAPGQGALAIEIRSNDPETEKLISQLNDKTVEQFVRQERRFLQLTEGGCHASVGSHSFVKHNRFYLTTYWHNGTVQHKITISSEKPNTLAETSHQIHVKLQENKPESIWLVRDHHQVSELSQTLTASGKTVTCQPMIKTQSVIDEKMTDEINQNLETTNWIFFTSSNGVRSFFEKIKSIPSSVKIASIGAQTEETLKQMGYSSSLLASGGHSDSMAEDFLKTHPNAKQSVMYLTTSSSDNQLETMLKNAGHFIVRYNIYKTMNCEADESQFTKNKIDKVVVYSSSAAEPVKQLLTKINQQPKWISIGPKTSETIVRLGETVYAEAEYPDSGNLLAAILK